MDCTEVSCAGHTVDCPHSQDCEVLCGDCVGLTANCPNWNGSCTIDCQTEGGCHDLEINWVAGEEPPLLVCGEYMWTCGGADNDCTECPDSFGGDDTYEPTTDPTIQPATTSEPAALECDLPRTGQIESGEYLYFSFENSIERDVSFSTCFSSIDTTLFLFDANGNAIQSQSTNQCNGDDCHDESVILFSNCADRTETFTMRSLPIGHYELRLHPYGSGGSYVLRAACDPAYANDMDSADSDDSEDEDENQVTYAGDIECGEPRIGQIAFGEMMHFFFNNSMQRDVSFSTCFGEIDTTLRLFAVDANSDDEIDITSQSTNQCDGDDCHDYSVFSHSDCHANTETFTMSALDIGQYTLHLRPYSSGGSYDLRVICDTNLNSARADPEMVDDNGVNQLDFNETDDHFAFNETDDHFDLNETDAEAEPTLEPTLQPTSLVCSPLLHVDWYGTELNECEGDCDSDSDCTDGLVCWHQEHAAVGELPAGCSGTPFASQEDYCYNPSRGPCVTTSSAPTSEPSEPIAVDCLPLLHVDWQGTELNECEGDCDSDASCADGLVCWHQEHAAAGQLPAGCRGTPFNPLEDYCYNPSRGPCSDSFGGDDINSARMVTADDDEYDGDDTTDCTEVSCAGHTVDCPHSQDCEVLCGDCVGLTVNCPNWNGSCTIDCQTEGGCHDLEINWVAGEEPPLLICGEYMWTCGGADNDCTECPDSFGGDDTYEPTTDPTIQPATTSEPAALECDLPRTGQIESGEYLYFSFENSIERDVSFSTCFSSIDTTLFLFDANGNAIQSQSTNQCNGDDCHDESVILFSNCADRTETFTMRSLPIGHYELRLHPYGSGGSYVLRAACDPAYANDMDSADSDDSE